MKVAIIEDCINGYHVGNKFLDFCLELESAGIKSISELPDYPELNERVETLGKEVQNIMKHGSEWERFGLQYVASNLHPIKYFKGARYYKIEAGIP